MIRILARLPIIDSLIKRTLIKKYTNSNTYLFNFDSGGEIIENFLDNIALIGINLPSQKNLLSESAVDKLYDSIIRFNDNHNYTVAVLHGCGGNFCTGLESSQNAMEKGRNLIKAIHESKKPIVGSLNGSIKNFGFELATVCDLKAIDESALIGVGDICQRSGMAPEVYKRLVASVGITKAMEMILTTCTWTANEAKQAGFVNQIVESGTALGKAILWAQSITLTSSKIAIKAKSKIICQIEKSNT